MNRNQNFKTLEQKKQELANLKAEWEEMKKQEKLLKEKFYNSPFAERAQIKRELKTLQEAIFEKKESGKSISFCARDEEMLQRLKNPTGEPTDPHELANLLKTELREVLNGSRQTGLGEGDTIGDILPANHWREFCYFGSNEDLKEKIANLARKRQEPLDLDKITTRMVQVKSSDLSTTDFNEIISLIRQVQNFLEEKERQRQRPRLHHLRAG